jgi:hypothetical protein
MVALEIWLVCHGSVSPRRKPNHKVANVELPCFLPQAALLTLAYIAASHDASPSLPEYAWQFLVEGVVARFTMRNL